MTSHVKLRKERTGLVDYDTQIKEVRLQMVDQLKVLDIQLEQKSQQLLDLTDYLRRRGEIEGEYARSLDKLSERFSAKIKRKDPGGHSVAQVWLTLLTQNRQEIRGHSGLSESYSNILIQPLTHCLEYTQRLARKSKDVCTQLQDGLLKVTTELQTAWRTYYQHHSEYASAEGKLKEAEKMEEKQKQSAARKVEKLIGKRQGKVQEIHQKCTKARNEYLLNLAAANASMNKYYVQDISSIIDCADAGYHLTLGRVMRAYLSSRWRAQHNLDTDLQQLQGTMNGLDERQDRDVLLQAHHNIFCMPQRFPYLPHDGDQVSEVSASECEMRSDLENRYEQIQARLTAVTQETEEAHKCLLAGHAFLLESICDDDLEPSGASSSALEGSAENLASRPSVAQRRANLQEAEHLYVTRVKDYLVDSSLVSKLQAKHDLLKVAVEKAAAVTKDHQPRTNRKSLRRIHSSCKLTHNRKLFSGDMLSFIQASGQQIPLVVESCVRFINLNGLHHEGIFRVPGSQFDVKSLRDAFERGEDPLAERDCSLDSVAGVLKLYFRSLEKPLFPIDSTGQLLEHSQLDAKAERAAHLKTVISSYPDPLTVVLRYLFAFLHHVSQYSDENMMQPYNLAVCLGPSLVRLGALDVNVVSLQTQINNLVKELIIQHESIFPSQAEVQGPVYEKCMTREHDDGDAITEEGDGEAENTHDLETGTMTDQNTTSSFPALTQRKDRRASADSYSRVISPPLSPATSIAQSVKFMLTPSMISQGKPPRAQSLGFIWREAQDPSPSEVITVDKEVCRQMNAVFKELLSKKAIQDPSSSSHFMLPFQRKGRRKAV